MKFEVTILGCGSATPTLRRNPTSQLVNIQEKFFLVDCGENTQIQLRKRRIKFQRINHIFISHMHGDHYFGLIGLVSSLHLLGRSKVLHVYGPPALEKVLAVQLEASGTRLKYPLEFHPLNPDNGPQIIFEDTTITVETIPLTHSVPCTGFLFREKKKRRKIIKKKIEGLNVPHFVISHLKDGKDYTTDEGETFLFEEYTTPALPSHSYAFCSDTAYREEIIEQIKDVDLLYHEATFLDALKDRAKSTFHSTAKEAAQIAKLANVNKLVIGHFSARYKAVDEFVDESRTVFENTYIASDGNAYRIDSGVL